MLFLWAACKHYRPQNDKSHHPYDGDHLTPTPKPPHGPEPDTIPTPKINNLIVKNNNPIVKINNPIGKIANPIVKVNNPVIIVQKITTPLLKSTTPIVKMTDAITTQNPQCFCCK